MARTDPTVRPGAGIRPARTATTPNHGPLTSAQSAELNALLGELVAVHESMIALNTEHRAAITSADLARLRACVEGQAAAASRLAELDARRAALVRSVLSGLSPQRALLAGPQGTPGITGAELTLSHLAQRLPESERAPVLSAAAQARELMDRAQREQAALRDASRSLLGFTTSLVAMVARAVSHTGTYSRPGSQPPQAHHAVVSAVDLTT
jgi:hypothetical protein